jgi:hypothetical protein
MEDDCSLQFETLPNAPIFFIFNDKKIVGKAFLHSRWIGSISVNRSVAFTYIPEDLRDKCLDVL